MKTVGMMHVDVEHSPIGLPARCADELAGVPVLRRAVERVLAAESLTGVALLAPGDQHGRIGELLGPAARRVGLHAAGPAPVGRVPMAAVAVARRWALGNWRGGIAGACWFDELLGAAAAMADLAGELSADAVALLSPAAAIADAELIDATVANHDAHQGLYKLSFSQAPPGVGTVALRPDLLGDFAATGVTVGRVLGYDPSNPGLDLVGREPVVKLPVEVMACARRMLADTQRGFALIEQLIEQVGDAPSAEAAARAAAAMYADAPEPWPVEVDLELTTARPVADTLRPAAPDRGPIAREVVARLAASIRECPADDLCVTLTGGDALEHPDAFEIAAELKAAGALGVAARTTAVGLDDARIARLLESEIDVLVVELDAASADTYRRLKGSDAFEQVVGSLQSLLKARAARPRPQIVAEFAKCPANLAELEPFFDYWRSVGAEPHIAAVHGWAGQFDPPAGVGWSIAPPARGRCGRIQRRLTVLADGVAVACENDYRAAAPVGRLNGDGLMDIWTGQPLVQLRTAHGEGRFDATPLCAACTEWHRS